MKKRKQILLFLGVVTLFLGIVLIGGVAYASLEIKPLGLFYSQNSLYTADFSPTIATVAINQSQFFTITLKSWSGATLDIASHTISYTWFLDSNRVPITGSYGFLFFGGPGANQVRVQILVDGNQINCYATLNVTNPDGSMSVPTPIPTPTPNPLTSLVPNNPLAKALIVVIGLANTALGSTILLLSKRLGN